ncbi:MAG: hypothetical protein ABFS35_15835 [Bacteroidota bacterium]
MITFKKHIITATIIIIASSPTYSQFWGSILGSGKWSINAESNAGPVFSTDFGKGWELAYGGGAEWSPFTKILYFGVKINYVHQFLNDNTPNQDIFTSMPDKINMHSRYLRSQYGGKIRFDWALKKTSYNDWDLFVSYYYQTDYLLKENIELHYGSTTENTNTIHSTELNSGSYYELGYSWTPNDQIKLDISLYMYYLEAKHKIFNNGFGYLPNYKLGFGINTGIYLSL